MQPSSTSSSTSTLNFASSPAATTAIHTSTPPSLASAAHIDPFIGPHQDAHSSQFIRQHQHQHQGTAVSTTKDLQGQQLQNNQNQGQPSQQSHQQLHPQHRDGRGGRARGNRHQLPPLQWEAQKHHLPVVICSPVSPSQPSPRRKRGSASPGTHAPVPFPSPLSDIFVNDQNSFLASTTTRAHPHPTPGQHATVTTAATTSTTPTTSTTSSMIQSPSPPSSSLSPASSTSSTTTTSSKPTRRFSRGDLRPTFYNPFEVKRRQKTSRDQSMILEHAFMENPMPDATVRDELAQRLDRTPRGIQVWFQNRRAKDRQRQQRKQQQQQRQQQEERIDKKVSEGEAVDPDKSGSGSSNSASVVAGCNENGATTGHAVATAPCDYLDFDRPTPPHLQRRDHTKSALSLSQQKSSSALEAVEHPYQSADMKLSRGVTTNEVVCATNISLDPSSNKSNNVEKDGQNKDGASTTGDVHAASLPLAKPNTEQLVCHPLHDLAQQQLVHCTTSTSTAVPIAKPLSASPMANPYNPIVPTPGSQPLVVAQDMFPVVTDVYAFDMLGTATPPMPSSSRRRKSMPVCSRDISTNPQDFQQQKQHRQQPLSGCSQPVGLPPFIPSSPSTRPVVKLNSKAPVIPLPQKRASSKAIVPSVSSTLSLSPKSPMQHSTPHHSGTAAPSTPEVVAIQSTPHTSQSPSPRAIAFNMTFRAAQVAATTPSNTSRYSLISSETMSDSGGQSQSQITSVVNLHDPSTTASASSSSSPVASTVASTTATPCLEDRGSFAGGYDIIHEPNQRLEAFHRHSFHGISYQQQQLQQQRHQQSPQNYRGPPSSRRSFALTRQVYDAANAPFSHNMSVCGQSHDFAPPDKHMHRASVSGTSNPAPQLGLPALEMVTNTVTAHVQLPVAHNNNGSQNVDVSHGRRNSCPADFIDFFQKGLLFTSDSPMQTDSLNTIQEDDSGLAAAEASVVARATETEVMPGENHLLPPQQPSTVPATHSHPLPQMTSKHHSYSHKLPDSSQQTASQSVWDHEWPPPISSADATVAQPSHPPVPLAYDPTAVAGQLPDSPSPQSPITATSAQKSWAVKRSRTQPTMAPVKNIANPLSQDVTSSLNTPLSTDCHPTYPTLMARSSSGVKRQLDDYSQSGQQYQDTGIPAAIPSTAQEQRRAQRPKHREATHSGKSAALTRRYSAPVNSLLPAATWLQSHSSPQKTMETQPKQLAAPGLETSNTMMTAASMMVSAPATPTSLFSSNDGSVAHSPSTAQMAAITMATPSSVATSPRGSLPRSFSSPAHQFAQHSSSYPRVHEQDAVASLPDYSPQHRRSLPTGITNSTASPLPRGYSLDSKLQFPNNNDSSQGNSLGPGGLRPVGNNPFFSISECNVSSSFEIAVPMALPGHFTPIVTANSLVSGTGAPAIVPFNQSSQSHEQQHQQFRVFAISGMDVGQGPSYEQIQALLSLSISPLDPMPMAGHSSFLAPSTPAPLHPLDNGMLPPVVTDSNESPHHSQAPQHHLPATTSRPVQLSSTPTPSVMAPPPPVILHPSPLASALPLQNIPASMTTGLDSSFSALTGTQPFQHSLDSSGTGAYQLFVSTPQSLPQPDPQSIRPTTSYHYQQRHRSMDVPYPLIPNTHNPDPALPSTPISASSSVPTYASDLTNRSA